MDRRLFIHRLQEVWCNGKMETFFFKKKGKMMIGMATAAIQRRRLSFYKQKARELHPLITWRLSCSSHIFIINCYYYCLLLASNSNRPNSFSIIWLISENENTINYELTKLLLQKTIPEVWTHTYIHKMIWMKVTNF